MSASGLGPDVLGRGVVIRPGGNPAGLVDATRVRIGPSTLESPQVAVRTLQSCWLERRRVVVELEVGADALKAFETFDRPPYELAPDFEFARERLHFLVWANNYDATRGVPVWWHGRLACRLGARPGERTDVILPDGTEAWCDGGPREPLDLPVVHRESIEAGCLTMASPHRETEAELADDQRKAVLHGRGAARIIAPAGSGKTRVLTARLRHLLRERGLERDIVTAVAYNRRAADEMKARTRDFQPRVSTLHGLGYGLLNAQRPRALVDERDVREILRTLVEVPRELNQDPMAAYLEALTQVRIGLQAPAEVEAARDDVPGFAAAFPRYRSILESRGAVDFEEQIYGALELLLRDPERRRQAQRRCRHLLVDEFQDLTPAYLLMIRLLAAPAYQVFGVGDDDQVIYGYAGANPDYLIRFPDYFPGAAPYALGINYRCPVETVQAASALLRHNRRRVAKQIEAAPGKAPHPASLQVHAETVENLAVKAVEVVQGWLSQGVLPTSVAVLTRVNATLMPMQIAFQEEGIPCATAVGLEILQRTGIRTTLAYLRIATGGERIARQDVLDTIRRPSRKIRRGVIEGLERRSFWTLRDLRDFFDRLEDWEGERCLEYLDDLEHLRNMAAGATTARLLRRIKVDIGLGSAMQTLDASHAANAGSHLDDLQALEQVAERHPDAATFESWLRQCLQQSGSDGVTLSTVHRVKGMEWDHVLVYDASSELMPHRLADDHEEERRVFHVAMTRARKALAILSKEGQASPFIKEMRQPPASDKRKVAASLRDRHHALQARPAVEAQVGLRIVAPGGYPGVVSRLDRDFFLVDLDEGRSVRNSYGSHVEMDGREVKMIRPGQAVSRPHGQNVFEALRAWRSETAKSEGLPAYFILHDRHLQAIADQQPRSMKQLCRCDGMGPTRLDKYGDEILAVIDQVLRGR